MNKLIINILISLSILTMMTTPAFAQNMPSGNNNDCSCCQQNTNT
ncbi:hypothetical protein VKI21_14010 [Cyanobacterium aponinum UTEX 3222]|nr:hypothetical protein [Cyanobacterium aponinum]WRL37591.1 hypothetical protein VKI22_13305 [Cyanobacterium aponinum UTEX 3221]WRL41158.1 hypothetical protein VKI21_14010 [Cyanobacterium aponinum UTEX 3222]